MRDTRLAITIGVILTGAALAHERRDISKYQVVVGWIVEPALDGQKNGVDFRVTNTETQQPVEGAEKTVQVEVTHVPTGVSKVFSIRTIFRDPGHYTADLMLTAPGHYIMRFFGTIEGVSINETFNSKSGGGGYNDVESAADIQFPTKVAEVREVEAVVRHMEEEYHGIQESAANSGSLAAVGIVLGAIGTVLGASSLIRSMRRAK